MNVKVVVTGDKETIQKLNTLKNGMMPEIGDQMVVAGTPMYSAFATYAPQRPESKYKRTYTYRELLSVETGVSGGVAKYELTQGASYSGLLRGDASGRGQVWFHHLWQTTKSIIDKFTPVVTFKIQQVVDAFVRRVMGS